MQDLTLPLKIKEDCTKCLMFINTPKSVKWSASISKNLSTVSPWTYSELLISKLIRNKSRKVHRTALQKSFSESADGNILVEYVLDSKHLIDIQDFDLEYFEDHSVTYKNAFQALDDFYLQNGIDWSEEIIND